MHYNPAVFKQLCLLLTVGLNYSVILLPLSFFFFFFKSLIMHCLLISEGNAVLSERQLDTPQGVKLKNVNYLDIVTESVL